MRPIPGREHKSMSLKCCTIFILQLHGSSTTAVMSIYASKRYFGSTIMWSALAILGGDFRAKKKKKRQTIQQRNKNDDKKVLIFGQHTSKSSSPSQRMYTCGVYLYVCQEADSIWHLWCLSDHCASPSSFEIQLCIKGYVFRNLKSGTLHILIEQFCPRKNCCQRRTARWDLERWEVPGRRRPAFQNQEETPLYCTFL